MRKYIIYALWSLLSFGVQAKDLPCFGQWSRHCRMPSQNRLFVKTILQLVAQENQRIIRARAWVQYLAHKKTLMRSLTPQETAYLRCLYTHYKVSTISSLLEKMDIIPPSLAIAQAIEESGWGRARVARQKNSYFGMISKKRYLRAYPTVQHGVIAYMDNLNQRACYQPFRNLRKKLRQGKRTIEGERCAAGLIKYATLGRYIVTIQRIIRTYKLSYFDIHLPQE